MSDTIDANSYGFSQSVKASGLLFCSGQVGVAEDGSTPDDPEQQFDLAFASLGKLLEAEGCKISDLVELTSFHVDYPNHMEAFMKAKARFLGGTLPTWTAVGVAALGYPETLVEIKAIAKVPDQPV